MWEVFNVLDLVLHKLTSGSYLGLRLSLSLLLGLAFLLPLALLGGLTFLLGLQRSLMLLLLLLLLLEQIAFAHGRRG